MGIAVHTWTLFCRRGLYAQPLPSNKSMECRQTSTAALTIDIDVQVAEQSRLELSASDERAVEKVVDEASQMRGLALEPS